MQRSTVIAGSNIPIRTRSLFESRLTHAALLARVENYATMKTVLQQTRQLDDQVPAARRHERERNVAAPAPASIR